MATKVTKRKPAADKAVGDLSVLQPNRHPTIAGRVVEMREYGFFDSLPLLPLLEPILVDLEEQAKAGAPWPDFNSVPSFLGNHADVLVHLIAKAASVEMEWMRGLNAEQGYELIWWWWIVNGPFCKRCAEKRLVTAQVMERQARQLVAGQTQSTT
ncbi:hypothetical protein N7414_15770 [Pseudomonas sp. GD04087]|uniref:DUF6631 family protein n=1 Tax=unclassified Pseudomonas TaxID=196821 RepID=UPI00244A9EEF|nr:MULTISPECIES: DUF6631 family protein [unclassified Pseudomonas]MDH0290582.1 hypothetical protein [Pseudomonas sp. GD04087]MDH1051499.1 hypothetical protein [Pseudomonas sp. GD03903]MDH2003067.1 hypothetical protein [Pseudomonas sp. GD03691]